MKNLFAFCLLAMLGTTSCDNDEVIKTQSNSIKYIGEQPILINLNKYNEGGSQFVINTTPQHGSASVINNKFLLYAPTSQQSDNVIVKKTGGGQQELIELKFQADASACNIAAFDKKTIKKGESLSFDFAANDKLCAGIVASSIVGIVPTSNESMYFNIEANISALPRFSGTLYFKSPQNFVGTAKAIYLVGVNYFKGGAIPGAPNQSIEELINHPEKYYEYVLYGLAEIEVVE